MKCDIVAEGGGTKISGLVGALEAIEAAGFEPSHLAGTSAGAIVMSMRAAGYSTEEMRQILLQTDYTDFLDGNGWGRKAWNVLRYKGIYHGAYFHRFMQEKLSKKGVLYFKDLLSKDPADHRSPQYRYRFKCFAADITRGRLVTWPDDASLYGMQPDYVPVAWAVRTSMSIPFFFRPVKEAGSQFVDGGLISNFPIWVWDELGVPKWPTFGLLLHEDEGKPEVNDIGFWPHEFFLAMFKTMLSAHDRRFIRPDDFENRTIRIPTMGVGTVDFDITQMKKEELFHSGKKVGRAFLDSWDWQTYVDWATKVRGCR